MADLQIKITSAGAKESAAELDKLSAAVTKLTAAEKQLAKSAKESADVFKQALKPLNDAKDVEGALSAMTKEAKALGEVDKAAEKSIATQKRWLDAAKKLRTDIPLVGVAIDVLKNPITAITLAIAFLVNRLGQMNAAFAETRKVVGDGKIGDQIHNIRRALDEAATAAGKFKESVDKALNRPESIEENIDRMRGNFDRQLQIEGRIDAAAKAKRIAEDPNNRDAIEAEFAAKEKLREQRRLEFGAQLPALGQFKAEAVVREGMAALPGAQARLAKAQARRDALLEFADKNTTELGPIEAQIAEIEKPGLLGDFGRFTMFGFNTRDRDATYDSLLSLREGAKQGNVNADSLRRKANLDFEAEQNRFRELQARTEAAAGSVRAFSDARGPAVEIAAGLRPFNAPNGIGPQFSPDLQRAMEEYNRKLIMMFGQLQREVDAASRAAANNSQNSQ